LQEEYPKNYKNLGNCNLKPRAYKKIKRKLPRSGFVHPKHIAVLAQVVLLASKHKFGKASNLILTGMISQLFPDVG